MTAGAVAERRSETFRCLASLRAIWVWEVVVAACSAPSARAQGDQTAVSRQLCVKRQVSVDLGQEHAPALELGWKRDRLG